MPLDETLAEKLRSAATAQERWRQERDQLIKQAHEAGGSLREIGSLVGLSHIGVRKIIHAGRS